MTTTATQLKSDVLTDMKTAMIGKEADKLLAIKAVKAAIDKFEKENPGSPEIYKALKPLVKQRIDSVEVFKAAGNTELAAKEELELSIINGYLKRVQPEVLSSEELDNVINVAIAGGANDLGKIMKYFKDNFEGLYDGKTLSSTVREKLS